MLTDDLLEVLEVRRTDHWSGYPGEPEGPGYGDLSHGDVSFLRKFFHAVYPTGKQREI